MSNKHTPGPWTVESVSWGFYIKSQFDVVVAIADPDGRYGTIDNEANARLIAAAPELLEALLLFITLYGTDDVTAWQYIRDKAVSAIAKAEGEQP